MDSPAVDGRWVSLVRQVSVNQVEDNDAPAIISTRISFSIPRMESANLWHRGMRVEEEEQRKKSGETRCKKHWGNLQYFQGTVYKPPNLAYTSWAEWDTVVSDEKQPQKEEAPLTNTTAALQCLNVGLFCDFVS